MRICNEEMMPQTRAERIQFAMIERLDTLIGLMQTPVSVAPVLSDEAIDAAQLSTLDASATSGAQSIEEMTKIELMAYCRERGIDFKTAMPKDEILAIARGYMA